VYSCTIIIKVGL